MAQPGQIVYPPNTAFQLADLTTANTFTGIITAPNFISSVATGTQPIAVTSTTKNTNLNSDQVDGADLDTDGTLAANSDVKIASQKATKTYADTKQTALGYTPVNKAGDTMSGDLKLGTAGNGFYVKEGSNATMGVVTLSGGTATVSTTKVTSTSRILLTTQGGTLTNVGATYISARTPATSFVITSLNILDSSDVAWLIVEPA